jgi:glycosyltransferase involved in cell wall biosynthesis
MKYIYQKHDIFLLPANNEPASISILEAMSHGLVVICSDSCATKTYLPSFKNSIFKSNNAESLKKCLMFYLKCKSKLIKLKSKNKIFCDREYSFKEYYKKLITIFKYYESQK